MALDLSSVAPPWMAETSEPRLETMRKRVAALRSMAGGYGDFRTIADIPVASFVAFDANFKDLRQGPFVRDRRTESAALDRS